MELCCWGLAFVGEGLEFTGLFSGGGLSVEASLFEPGDLARLAESKNHCLIDTRWLMNGC